MSRTGYKINKIQIWWMHTKKSWYMVVQQRHVYWKCNPMKGCLAPLCREAHMMQLEAAKSATIKRFIMWFKFIHASTFLKCLDDLTTRPPSSSLFLKRHSGTWYMVHITDFFCQVIFVISYRMYVWYMIEVKAKIQQTKIAVTKF